MKNQVGKKIIENESDGSYFGIRMSLFFQVNKQIFSNILVTT